METKLPEEVIKIYKKIENNGYEVYIVGGAVRDLLTGRPVIDWDFTTNATPEDILKIFKDSFYDNNYGTVGINSESGFKPHEVTTYRTEHGYSDHRRPDKVLWGKSLEEDLKRRDFTINALAIKLDGMGIKIIDLFEGQNDLKNKVVKAVGNANERFNEDALRMMRAIRIASQLGFTIEEKTFEAIKMHSNLINEIAAERVRDELLKTISSSFSFEGIVIFKSSSLMHEILPELEENFGVEQKSPGRHHTFDVGTHLVMALKYCNSDDPITRLATLIHDIGKARTFKKIEDGTITFYNHEVVSTKIAAKIADRLKLSNKDKNKLLKLVRWHMFSVNENQTDSALRRFIRNVGKENIPDILMLRVADRLGGGARETSWRLEEFKRRLIEVQKQPFTVRDLKIDGNDVMKTLRLRPGPKVGEILNNLFEKVVEKKIENSRDTLLKRIKELKSTFS
ncbi:hypothetical protein A2961_04870 [Candidatus Woesebacteria bacterium RIFCSPLOWO2_01_FULL_39_21]|uniref:HD domain-containing protein n=1 Tax=Candidatus Woesebacteria bacterium RIFCSPLOWO2_01_FULL_39_21 TaxID=1802519 RepID=A0A1F8BDE9_9BACT|nr:MAG: hypothetical protein A2691_03245 [Candidatus Woesebacteria bacterium RIFCSPHIGHO2_01_FULL_39_23]OGM62076.1 MAG: hypothetical protein A2961_04870 [Candidatus Woesebacteria bacterium RIFCSPLOWO2_01_FULL_39_21]